MLIVLIQWQTGDWQSIRISTMHLRSQGYLQNKLPEASEHHATSGRRHVLVVEALIGKKILAVWH
jgi:hypothetical protein